MARSTRPRDNPPAVARVVAVGNRAASAWPAAGGLVAGGGDPGGPRRGLLLCLRHKRGFMLPLRRPVYRLLPRFMGWNIKGWSVPV